MQDSRRPFRQQLALDLATMPAPSLAGFVPGANAEAVAALSRVADGSPGERQIFLWGESGSGRTHLLRATMAAIAGRGGRARYVSLAGADALAEADADLDGLALDDVHGLDAATQILAFRICNAFRARRAALLVAADAPPAGLGLRDDLATRLAWGLVFQLHPLGEADRRSAVCAHARVRGLALSDELLDYVLARAPRDIASLLALVDALDRHSLGSRRAVGIALARELLEGGPRT